jgi:uncharacterized protein
LRLRKLILPIAAVLITASCISAFVGFSMGRGILHPARLHDAAERRDAAEQMFARTGTTPEDLPVTAPDGVQLRGWKVRARASSGDWVLLFHGVGDNRTGVLGHAEFLLRNGYSVVMMDSRAHGQSGGDLATYGWKERYDTVAIANALYRSERVRCLTELGVSMGAAIALQSAAVEPRIAGVVAEDPFTNLREVAYDYAGLHLSPLLGKTLFRPAAILALDQAEKEGGFHAQDVSPERAVASRPFSILLICGREDHTIPCRHARRIFNAAIGPKQLWEVPGGQHAAALGQAPAEYESRTIKFLSAACGAARPAPSN